MTKAYGMMDAQDPRVGADIRRYANQEGITQIPFMDQGGHILTIFPIGAFGETMEDKREHYGWKLKNAVDALKQNGFMLQGSVTPDEDKKLHDAIEILDDVLTTITKPIKKVSK